MFEKLPIDMRIKFEFEEYPDELKELAHKVIWVDNFPCRLQDGDIVMPKILGGEYEHIAESHYLDNPEVSCTRFDVDTNGYFQNVWLTV